MQNSIFNYKELLAMFMWLCESFEVDLQKCWLLYILFLLCSLHVFIKFGQFFVSLFYLVTPNGSHISWGLTAYCTKRQATRKSRTQLVCHFFYPPCLLSMYIFMLINNISSSFNHFEAKWIILQFPLRKLHHSLFSSWLEHVQNNNISGVCHLELTREPEKVCWK